MTTFLFILGIIMFVALVVIHELGHAIAARRNGVVVEEFGIGFPPTAWGKKLKNGVLFTINWLPLGGFVKLKGESDDARGKGAYGAASMWAKSKILLAGVVMNWATAIVIFTILALTGIPKILDNQFTIASDTIDMRDKVTAQAIGKDSPAERAGLKENDVIVSIAGTAIDSPEQLRTLTKQNAGKTVPFVYVHAGATKESKVTLNAANDKNGQLGVAPFAREFYRSTWSAPIVGVGLTVQLSALTVNGLGTALYNLGSGLVQKISPQAEVRQAGDAALTSAGSSVAGPVGIVNLLMQVANAMGLAGVLFIIAIISLTLAVMNVLPIPALDGGRLFVTLLFRAMKKPLRKETEEKIHATGFMVLMALFVLITVLDVTKLTGAK